MLLQRKASVASSQHSCAIKAAARQRVVVVKATNNAQHQLHKSSQEYAALSGLTVECAADGVEVDILSLLKVLAMPASCLCREQTPPH